MAGDSLPRRILEAIDEAVLHPSKDLVPAGGADPMAGWDVKDAKVTGGEETQAFIATITHDGDPVLHVTNDGHGGGNKYFGFTHRGWKQAKAQLRADVETALAMIPGGDAIKFEKVDAWVSAKIAGVPFAKYVADVAAAMKKWEGA